MNCQRCGTLLNPGSSFCTNCGAGVSNTQQFSPQYQTHYAPMSPKSNKKTIIIVASVIVSLIAATGIGIGIKVKMDNDRKAAEAAAAQAAYEAEQAEIERQRNDYSWVPSGWSKFDLDYNLAYTGADYEDADCWGDRCWSIQVISHQYCSSLTIYMEFLSDGVSFDTDSDSVYSVAPGDRFYMAFNTLYDIDSRANVTDIYCS